MSPGSTGEERVELREPWLVAAWPGMGAVAQMAAGYLVQGLAARQVDEIAADGYFEPQAVAVNQGLVGDAELSHSRVYAWRDPQGRRDLLIFLGEMQPPRHGGRFCRELLAIAAGYGVTRVVTFAAMASTMHPEADAQVHAAATDELRVEELTLAGVELMPEGQIGGLNGVLLSIARDVGLPGICLLGELPYFASSVPNPKASAAVLRTFVGLTGIELDLEALDDHAAEVERSLVAQLHRLQQSSGGEAEHVESFEASGDEDDPEVLARIEALFLDAEIDRTKALELKAELDRQGLFGRYEDRFLDLFKQAE